MKVKFSLINSIGQEFEVANVSTGLITNISGIGGGVNNTYSQLESKWIRMSSKSVQGGISGEMVFHGTDAYTKEALFTAFLRQSSELRLKVITPSTTKYIDVDITSYELKAVGLNTLVCPIAMTATSLWYTSTAEKARIIASLDDEVRYSYRWPSRFNDYSDGYLEVNNSGSIEASFGVEFEGGIANPVIALEVEGVETAKVVIAASVSSGSKIIYSSKDGELYCFSGTNAQIETFKQKGTTTGLTNLALGFSLNNANFFKLPVGTSRLHITADSSLTNPIMVSTYKYYRTV